MNISKNEKKFHRLYKTAKIKNKCGHHSTLCDDCTGCEFYNKTWCYPYLTPDIILKLFILLNLEDCEEIYEHWQNVSEFKEWLFGEYLYRFTPELRDKVQKLFERDSIYV